MKHRCLSAALALLLIGAGATQTALAQAGSTMPDPQIPCPAFARNDSGGWTVLAPVTLDFNGMLISFTVGTQFAPGSTSHGLEIPEILDRECGNIPRHAMQQDLNPAK